MASTVWNGSVDTDWNTAANWTPSGVPLASAHIQISTTNDCALDQSRSCASLTIDSGATLIGGGYKLTVTSEGDAASGTEGFAVNNDGIISGNLDLEINTTTATDIDLAGTSGNFRDLRLNDASCDVTMKADCTLDGTLVIAAGQLSTGTGGYGFSNLTVAGNCTVSAGATLEGNASSGATVRLLSLTVNGTYSATGGETIITGETGAGRAVDIVGTFTHNSGTLSIQTPADTLLRWPSSSSAYHIRINDASCIARPTGDNKPLIAGNLTISAGEFNTLEGGQDHALTVTGKTEITTGTLTLNGSTCLLNSGGTAGGLVLNANATVLADADSTVTMGSIEAGYDSSINIRLAGTNTINNYRSSTDKTMKLPPGVVDPVSSTTSFTVTTSATNTEVSAVNLVNLTFTPASGTPNFNLDSGYGGIDIEGDLTINTGATITSNNQAITVVGEVNVAGTLDCGSSVCSFGSLDSTGLTELADSSGSTLITNENSDGLSIVAGTFGTCVPAKIKHNNGTVTFNNHSDPAAHAAIVVGNSNATDGLYNAIIDGANTIVDTYDPGGAGQECKIHNNFTVTNGSFQVNGASNPFDVGGDVLVSAGKMFGDGSAPTGAMSFGSLTIESGAEFRATSGTTTILGEASGGFALFNEGTFTHNNGTVSIGDGTTAAETHIKITTLYNLIINSNADAKLVIFRPESSSTVTIANDLTLTRGVFYRNNVSDTLTVTGDVSVTSGSTLGRTNDSGASNFGSLTINSGGTYIATSGTTTINLNFRFEDGANFTHNSGTVTFAGATDANLEMEGGHSGRKTPTNPLKFHNLTSAKTGNYLNLYVDFTVESTFTITTDSTYGVSVRQPVYLTMGTATAQGTIAGPSSGTDNLYFATEATTSKILAANTAGLYPWIKTGNDWGWSAGNGGTINLENGDYQTTLNTETGYHGQSSPGDNTKTIKLTGDMKFDAVTVGSGDTLDLDGQRVEFGGNFTSTGNVNGGGLIFAGADYSDGNGSGDNFTSKTLVMDGGYCNPVQTTWQNIFLRNGTHTIGGTRTWTDTPLFVAGTANFTSNNTWGNITTTTGGTFDGNSTTITCSKDFNVAGGLLGTSAVEFNGSDESAANASATTWGFGSSLSIEFWFKTSFNGSSTVLDLAPSSGNNDRIQVLQTASEMAFKLWNSGGTSYQIGTTAFTVNPDDGKWHHLAFTSDGSTQKIYYDGRLAGEASHTITRAADPTLKLTIGMHSTLGSHYSGFMDELRFFSDVRTVGELRTDMLQGGTLADSGALVARYKFDEGTGTAIDNSQATAARDLVASGTGVWVGGGTFTYDTSTLKMTGINKNINFTGDIGVYKLTIATGGDTNAITVNEINGNNGGIVAYHTLEVESGKLASTTNEYIQIGRTFGNVLVAAGKGATALADLARISLYQNSQSGTANFPSASSGDKNITLKRFFINSDSSIEVLSQGNLTVTTEIKLAYNNTFNFNGNTLSPIKVTLEDTSGLTLGNGILDFPETGALYSVAGCVLSAGPGATVTGHTTRALFESQNDWAIVGNIINLDVREHELSVLGNVTNCIGEIHRWNPTIDTGQMLDADTADDRDVRLGSDLDRNTELVT